MKTFQALAHILKHAGQVQTNTCKITWRVLVLIVLSMLVPFFSSASAVAPSDPGKPLIEQVRKRGTLLVGVSVFVPWVMYDKRGQLIGYEVDVARRLAKDLGVQVEFVETPWETIIPSLLKGRFDLIISGMTITTPRNLEVNFSIPYSHSGIRLVASLPKTKGLTSIEHFNRQAITLTARKGTSAAALARTLTPMAAVKQFDDDTSALQEVVAGRAHAMLAATPFPEHGAARYPDRLYMPIEERLQRTSEAMAVRKGDADSLNVLNNWVLQRLEDGWLQDRHDYWFTTLDWQHQVHNK